MESKEIVMFIAFLGLIHISIGTALCLPVWISGRRRAKWSWNDLLILVLPYSCWALLTLTNYKPKSLANFGEALWLARILPVAAIIRVAIGQRIRRDIVSAGVIIVSSLVAVLLYLCVPILPE